MSQQLICDDCNEPIQDGEPFFQVTAQLVTNASGSLTVATNGEQRSFDYHKDHLPFDHPGKHESTPAIAPEAEPADVPSPAPGPEEELS